MKKLVVELADQADDFAAMQPRWRELLEAMSAIADNLVVRLISNDLKAQFVDQMMKLGIRPDIKRSSINQLLSSLRVSLNKQDGELASEAMQNHFEELRTAVGEAISFKVEEQSIRAV